MRQSKALDAARPWRDLWISLTVWGGVCAWLTIGKLALAALPPIDIPLIRSEFAASTVVVYGAIGAVGVVLAHFAGLPTPVGGGVSTRTRYLWPLLAGAGLGLAAIGVDTVTHGADFLAARTGQASFNVALPQAIPVYLAGPVLPEAAYHILPLPLLLLVTHLAVKTDRGRRRAFLVIAALVALIEPVLQGGGVIALGSGDRAGLFVTQFLPYFLTAYPMNLAACLAFGRAGFLSPILVRLGFYAIWHILYGAFLYHPHLG